MTISNKLKKILCASASALLLLSIGGLFSNNVHASTIHEHVAAKSLHGNRGVWLHNGSHIHIKGLLPGAYKVTIPSHRGEWIIPDLHGGAKQSKSYIKSLNFNHHHNYRSNRSSKEVKRDLRYLNHWNNGYCPKVLQGYWMQTTPFHGHALFEAFVPSHLKKMSNKAIINSVHKIKKDHLHSMIFKHIGSKKYLAIFQNVKPYTLHKSTNKPLKAIITVKNPHKALFKFSSQKWSNGTYEKVSKGFWESEVE